MPQRRSLELARDAMARDTTEGDDKPSAANPTTRDRGARSARSEVSALTGADPGRRGERSEAGTMRIHPHHHLTPELSRLAKPVRLE
jgi:hypothetical protein